MKPDNSPRRSIILVLLGMGIFYLIAAAISLIYEQAFNTLRPYLFEIAAIALIISIPVAYLVWEFYKQRRS